jgi:hypothetical protein
MNSYTYTISLGLRHPFLSLNEEYNTLSQIPMIIAGRLMDIGQKRTNLKGQLLEGLYSDSRCVFDFADYKADWQNSNTRSLPQGIEDILERLYSCREIFHSVNGSGGESYLSIGVKVDKMSGYIFEVELMKKLVEAGLSIELHLYPQEN